MENGSKLFNRRLYHQRRHRAAAQWDKYNFIKQEAAERLADRLADIARTFPMALDLGCHGGEVGKAISEKVGRLWSADSVAAMRPAVVCDEELLPFADGVFDLVTSALSLHHVNDLPGALIQIRRCLKEDGLFLAVIPGANTLRELRTAITQVSAEQAYPLWPRLSPMVEIRDAGALLQRAGFSLPVVDSDMITVEYDSAWDLLRDLRGMGESNVLLAQHKGFTSRSHLAAIVAAYEQRFTGGSVPATFEFITLTAWRPHSSQQRPAARGSGQINLGDVL